MKKRALLFLITCFAGLCAYLFIVFYNEAEKTAVRQLNDEQQIHAKQAARGIEDFFATWTGILNSFSKMDTIISLDADGKRYMMLFYEAHHEQIRSITRVDERGRILHTVPYGRTIGSDISGQKHMRKILQDRKPVVSDVFKTVQGFEAVALHVPVFKGVDFKGTVAVVIDFENLAKRYLEVIKIGKTGYAWVVSSNGTILYSPVPGFTGKSAFDAFRDFPTVISMAKDMLQGRQGTITYTFNKIGSQTVSPVKKYAVYMPVRIVNSFWSIVVASAEDEVLSSLASFRNRLILVIGMILLGGVLFSIVSAKAWLIVTEEQKRKRAEEELRASEQRYRHLFKQNPAPMLIYERGTLRMLAVNDAFLGSYGYGEEEALALCLPDLYPEEEKKQIIDLADRLVGHAYAGEWHHLRKDGSCITIVARSHDITYHGRSARIAVIADITDRKQAENALRYSEQKFMKAFHATPDAIVISRAADGLLLEVNDVFLRRAGYSREEILNKTTVAINLWANPSDRERYVAGVREQGRVRDMEAQFQTKTGALLDGLVSGESILLEDDLCLLTIIRDITERKKTEKELEKHRLHLEEMVNERTDELKRSQDALRCSLEEVTAAKKDLEAANARLKELDRLKSLFIASMSHELRTPLNSIIGFTGILLQGLAGELNAEQRKQLGMVKSSSEHLLSLITDIIDLSKIEAGKIDLFMESFDLSGIVREVLGSFQVVAERKALSLSAEIPPNLTVVSDKRRIRQVLVNLVGNSAKFTEQGGVSVTAQEKDGVIEVSVRDTGMGIKREDLDRLFKSFSQVTTAEMPKHEGTGLGLYLSRKLITLLGGEISVESEFGKGSVFSFTLPIKQ